MLFHHIGTIVQYISIFAIIIACTVVLDKDNYYVYVCFALAIIILYLHGISHDLSIIVKNSGVI